MKAISSTCSSVISISEPKVCRKYSNILINHVILKYRHLELYKRSTEKKILRQHFIGQDTGNHITAVKIAALDKPGIK